MNFDGFPVAALDFYDDLEIGEHQVLPRGYDRDHPRIELLRHKSVTVAQSFDVGQDWISTPRALDQIVGVWRAATPINSWLAEHVGHPNEH